MILANISKPVHISLLNHLVDFGPKSLLLRLHLFGHPIRATVKIKRSYILIQILLDLIESYFLIQIFSRFWRTFQESYNIWIDHGKILIRFWIGKNFTSLASWKAKIEHRDNLDCSIRKRDLFSPFRLILSVYWTKFMFFNCNLPKLGNLFSIQP